MSDGPVLVYSTGNVIDGELTRGRLEAEGIQVMVKGEGGGPYRVGPVYLWVAAQDEARAREIVDAIASGAYAADDDLLGELAMGASPDDDPHER